MRASGHKVNRPTISALKVQWRRAKAIIVKSFFSKP